MYDGDTHGRRLPFADLGELRKEVWQLLDAGATEIDWPHILAEGHDPTLEEILGVLEIGQYAHHRDLDGRYVARSARGGSGWGILAFSEIHEDRGRRSVYVLTAFRFHTGRSPPGRPPR